MVCDILASGKVKSVFVGKNTFRNHWVVSNDFERKEKIFQKKQDAVEWAKGLAKKNRPAEVMVQDIASASNLGGADYFYEEK